MVKVCCVKECKESWSPTTYLSFFAFPFNNEEMKAKWMSAAPGFKALSKYSSICSNHFLPGDYTECAGKRRLKKNAVPSIFGSQCPNGVIEIPNSIIIDEEECGDISDGINMKPEMINLLKLRLNALPQISMNNYQAFQKKEGEDEPTKRFVSVSVQTCPRLSGPSDREKELQHKIRILQNRLRRREKMIRNVKELVAHLKKSNQSSNELEDKFLRKFTKFDLELFKNEANNNNVAKNSKTYTQEMKEFATTLYSYSRRAYKFVRAKINLPHTATLRRWIAESVSTTKENDIRTAEVESNELEEAELTEMEEMESTEMEELKYHETEEVEYHEIEEVETVEYNEMEEVEEVEYDEMEELEYHEVNEADCEIEIEETKLSHIQENLVTCVPVLVAIPVSVSKTEPSHETAEKPCTTTTSISSPKRSNGSAEVTLKR